MPLRQFVETDSTGFTYINHEAPEGVLAGARTTDCLYRTSRYATETLCHGSSQVVPVMTGVGSEAEEQLPDCGM